jgi:hypothetical protein
VLSTYSTAQSADLQLHFNCAVYRLTQALAVQTKRVLCAAAVAGGVLVAADQLQLQSNLPVLQALTEVQLTALELTVTGSAAFAGFLASGSALADVVKEIDDSKSRAVLYMLLYYCLHQEQLQCCSVAALALRVDVSVRLLSACVHNQ